ncbi:hypothetical protein [Streptomyces tendae]|uniref:hypothetical protein n=1 Tax=Streptomyces tendae TaxID=1932 RepID=UPI00344ABEEB
MKKIDGVWVCGRCGASNDGVTARRTVAVGLIARRARGRSLRMTATAAGVTGSLRQTTAGASCGGGR